MFSFALEGLWLLGALAAVYLAGVFTSQWAKDKLNGVPTTLRSALKTAESAALNEVKASRDKIVADVATLLNKGKAAAAAEAAKVLAPAAPVAPAAPSVAVPITTVVPPAA